MDNVRFGPSVSALRGENWRHRPLAANEACDLALPKTPRGVTLAHRLPEPKREPRFKNRFAKLIQMSFIAHLWSVL